MIYKTKLIPLSYGGRVSLAVQIYSFLVGSTKKIQTRLIVNGTEPKTVESKLINIMYGE